MRKLLHLVSLLLVLLTLQVGPGICAAQCASQATSHAPAFASPHVMHGGRCCQGMRTNSAVTHRKPAQPCPSTHCALGATTAPATLFPGAQDAVLTPPAPVIVLPRSSLEDTLAPPPHLLQAALTQAARHRPLRV